MQLSQQTFGGTRKSGQEYDDIEQTKKNPNFRGETRKAQIWRFFNFIIHLGRMRQASEKCFAKSCKTIPLSKLL